MDILTVIIIAIIAAGAGFAGCYLWMLSREAALKSAQEAEISAKTEEVAAQKLECERAVAKATKEAEEASRARAAAEAEAGELAARVAALEGELEDAQVAGELDQFSDFQLLGMCDVFDAEEAEGALRRPYGDPAMEQLMNMEIVDFEMPHDGGRDKTPLWTLKPFWRRFTKVRRADMDARTEELRARRAARQSVL